MLLFDCGIQIFITDMHVELVFLFATLIVQFGFSYRIANLVFLLPAYTVEFGTLTSCLMD